MIELKLLHNNNIITLEVPSKAIIKSSGGMYHPNSMELLCVALGSCIGKHIIKYCSQNKINIESFESISITMDNKDFIVNVFHPKSITTEQKDDLEYVIKKL